jgi:hypothetical protein
MLSQRSRQSDERRLAQYRRRPRVSCDTDFDFVKAIRGQRLRFATQDIVATDSPILEGLQFAGRGSLGEQYRENDH